MRRGLQQDIPPRTLARSVARCSAHGSPPDEDNRGRIIFPQRVEKVIKDSQILEQGRRRTRTLIHLDTTSHPTRQTESFRQLPFFFLTLFCHEKQMSSIVSIGHK